MMDAQKQVSSSDRERKANNFFRILKKYKNCENMLDSG